MIMVNYMGEEEELSAVENSMLLTKMKENTEAYLCHQEHCGHHAFLFNRLTKAGNQGCEDYPTSSVCTEVRGDRDVRRTMLELLNHLDGFSSDERIKLFWNGGGRACREGDGAVNDHASWRHIHPGCQFCAVKTRNKPPPPDALEPWLLFFYV